MTYTEYIAYFEQLFSAHPTTCHLPDKDKRVFFCENWNELGQYRTGIRAQSFSITLLSPDISHSTDANGQCCTNWHGLLLVTHYHSDRKEGKDGWLKAMDLSLQVLEDIKGRMWKQARSGEAIFEGCKVQHCEDLFKSTTPRECVGDGSYSGWVLEFNIPIVDNSLSLDPDCSPTIDWKDGYTGEAW